MTYDLEEIDKQVVELTKAELTAIQIAERLGVSRACVNRSRIRTGIRVKQRLARIDHDTIDPKYAELHRMGYSDEGIGRRLGVSKRSAQRIREHLGLPPNYRFKHDRATVEKMYREGATDEQIAQFMDATPGTVYRIRRELRLVNPPAPAIPEDRKLEIITMLEDGASYNEVARTTRLCQTSIRRHFPGMGWTRQQVNENAYIRRLEKQVGIT